MASSSSTLSKDMASRAVTPNSSRGTDSSKEEGTTPQPLRSVEISLVAPVYKYGG
jgi:hypothetical protein